MSMRVEAWRNSKDRIRWRRAAAYLIYLGIMLWRAPVSGNGGAAADYDGTVTNWRMQLNGTMAAGGTSGTM